MKTYSMECDGGGGGGGEGGNGVGKKPMRRHYHEF